MSRPSEVRRSDALARPATVTPWPTDRLHSDKFPYLVVYLSPPFKSSVPILTVLEIPDGCYKWEGFLVDSAELFYKLNSMPCCLVIDEHTCAWFIDGDDGIRSNEPPKGGFVVSPECVGSQEIQDFVKWSNSVASSEPAAQLLSPVGQQCPAGERFQCWDNEEQILALDEDEWIDFDEVAQSAGSEWGVNSMDGWDRIETTLLQAVKPLAALIDGGLKVCVSTPENLGCIISRILEGHAPADHRLLEEFRRTISPLTKVLRQAGIYKDLQAALRLDSTHVAYALCLFKQTVERLHPELSLPQRWKLHLNLLMPALMCSSSNLFRVDVWIRVISSLREELLPLCQDDQALMVEEIEKFASLGKAAFKAGAEYFYLDDEVLYVIPSPTVRLDDSDDFHNEEGSAVVDLFGNANYFWHGQRVSEKLIMAPLTITDDEIALEASDRDRNLMIARRAEARYSLLKSGFYLDQSFLFHTSTRKGGKQPC